MREERSRAEERAAQVDVHHLVPTLDRHVGERRSIVHGGVVHEQVDSPELRDHALGSASTSASRETSHGRRRARADAERLDGARGLVDRAGELRWRGVGRAPDADDVRALVRERERGRAADASRGAGDDGDGVVKVQGYAVQTCGGSMPRSAR